MGDVCPCWSCEVALIEERHLDVYLNMTDITVLTLTTPFQGWEPAVGYLMPEVNDPLGNL